MHVRRLGGLHLVCLFAAWLLTGCAMTPAGDQLPPSFVLPKATVGDLGEHSGRVTARLAPGESAFWLLDRADFSFETRLALVDRAVASLDIQYFIWEKDPSSHLLMRRVLLAADRGVRVRLLLDDLTLDGHDAQFIAVGKHPNVEMRTFNPFRNRTTIGRVAEWFVGFGRLNHRMHNKTVLADGHFAIIGGRNIGDRYFGVHDEFVQNDLDIMAAGPIVADVARSFDVYWNSGSAYPLDGIARRAASKMSLDGVIELAESAYRGEREKLSRYPFAPSEWREHFASLSNGFAPGVGTYEFDQPIVRGGLPNQFYVHFKEFIAQATEKVIISTAYFVPDDEFADQIISLRQRGVRVVVVTNSLASNNHIIAHVAYKPWRKRLLAAGIEVYESRADAAAISEYTTPPTMPGFLGLHSKAAVVDDRWSFVGSPNIDPRSMVLNTENGFFVDSVELAKRVTALIERDIKPQNAWRLSLDDRRSLLWTNGDKAVKRQPAQGFVQRLVEFFINLMPIKNQA